MMYHAITTPLTEDGRLRVDAILGDPAAMAEVSKQRVETVAAAGFEVG